MCMGVWGARGGILSWHFSLNCHLTFHRGLPSPARIIHLCILSGQMTINQHSIKQYFLVQDLDKNANNNNYEEFVVSYYFSEESKNVPFRPHWACGFKVFPILHYCQRKIMRYGWLEKNLESSIWGKEVHLKPTFPVLILCSKKSHIFPLGFTYSFVIYGHAHNLSCSQRVQNKHRFLLLLYYL